MEVSGKLEHLDHFNMWERFFVPTEQEAGWASDMVWTFGRNVLSLLRIEPHIIHLIA